MPKVIYDALREAGALVQTHVDTLEAAGLWYRLAQMTEAYSCGISTNVSSGCFEIDQNEGQILTSHRFSVHSATLGQTVGRVCRRKSAVWRSSRKPSPKPGLTRS